MKSPLTLLIILLPLLCFSVTRQVSLDSSQAYTSIQTAINDTVSGDVVLVHPGRYIENINMSNKSSIILVWYPDIVDSFLGFFRHCQNDELGYGLTTIPRIFELILDPIIPDRLLPSRACFRFIGQNRL